MSTEPDLSEFEALSHPRRTECGVKKALAQLDAGDLAQLSAALEATHITGSAISTWLRSRGIRVAAQTINRHRRESCNCHA